MPAKTITLDENDLALLEQIFQVAVKAVDLRSAKAVLNLHSKVEAQLFPAPALVESPAPAPETPAA